MPYAPGISYDTSSVANGLLGATQQLQEGFKQYQMNKAKSSAAQSVVTGLLQSNPELMQGADEKTAKLLEKFKSGNTGLDDNIFLAGWATTTQKGWEAKQQMQARQLAMQGEQQKMQQMQTAAAADNAARSRLTQLSQYMDGVGGGVLKPEAQARLAAQAKNPMMASAAQAYAATGDVPRADTLLANESREEIASLRAQHALELFNLKQEHAGGYDTADAALTAAKKSGAEKVTVQQTSNGRWLANATFGSTGGAKMDQRDLQRSISLRTRISQLTNIIGQMRAGSTNYPMAGKLPALENELKTLQSEFDKLTEKTAPAPAAPTAPEVGGFIIRKSIPPAVAR